MTPLIRATGLSKRYRVGGSVASYGSLRDEIARFWRRGGTTPQNPIRDHWAVKDVSFDLAEGEVLGIIGRNGAGKSTLLKLLAGVTDPTSGRAEIRGRLASMLEVGTGFHPELTGRENAYLNAAILGMDRREFAAKFDEIVAFAEIAPFIDMPVKHYSSGMYARLAFSVAAHIDPEILIVDEVLAVGDAEFQNKCIGKMEEAGASGRTVLFVSHNVASILRLCTRVILLDRGRLVMDGSPHEVAARYLHGETTTAVRTWARGEGPGDDVAALSAVRILDEKSEASAVLEIDRPFSIEVDYWNHSESLKATVSLQFFGADGLCLFCTNDFADLDWWNSPRKPGLVRARVAIPANTLAEGTHYVQAAVCSYNPDRVHALEHDAVSFQVVDHTRGSGVRGTYGGDWPGVMRPSLSWHVMTVRD